ncbi:MAG: helix-turn-helix domain-containing protein [Dermatophilaceae bacterium]
MRTAAARTLRTQADLEGRLFVTVTELAALMQLDPRTVRRGIEEGSIPSIRVGRSTRIPVPKIRALIGLVDPTAA